jgi:hypothetical protein
MQVLNGEQDSSFHNQVWYLLIDYSLSELLADHGFGSAHMAGLLFQKMREMGMSLENLESIDQMLVGIAKEALLHFEPGSLELAGRIRVFCQQKMIDAADSAQTTRQCAAELNMEPAQEFHPFGTKMDGGWGCFSLQREANVSGNASPGSQYFIDLYLYREG